MHRVFLSAAFIVISASSLSPAQTDDETSAPARPFGVEVGGGTIAPITVGADAVFRVPGRVQFDVGMGWTPPGYVRLINEIVVAAGGYDEATGELIRAALSNSMALRGGIGWQPFRELGFEVRGGYTLLSLGGGATAAEVIETVIDVDMDEFGRERIGLYAALHNLHLEAGWRWPVSTFVSIRGGIGYIQTVTTRAGFRGDDELTDALERLGVERLLDQYLRTIFVRYGKSPTARISVYVGI